MTLTVSLVASTITLVSPFMPVNAFSSKGTPEQSCSAKGASGTDLNPNCIGGRIPSCTSPDKEDAAGCRDQGTCVINQHDKRKIDSTPACPFG